MQKWMYWLTEFERAGGNWRLKSENHQVNADWRQGTTMFDCLADKGATGWELVAAVRSANDTEWSLFFKKPVT